MYHSFSKMENRSSSGVNLSVGEKKSEYMFGKLISDKVIGDKLFINFQVSTMSKSKNWALSFRSFSMELILQMRSLRSLGHQEKTPPISSLSLIAAVMISLLNYAPMPLEKLQRSRKTQKRLMSSLRFLWTCSPRTPIRKSWDFSWSSWQVWIKKWWSGGSMRCEW